MRVLQRKIVVTSVRIQYRLFLVVISENRFLSDIIDIGNSLFVSVIINFGRSLSVT